MARTPPGPDDRSMAVFVPFVLPGERVVTRIVETSSERVEARCPYFQHCGGCHYQHIPYERQIEFKAQILRETFERVGKIALKGEIRVHPSPAWNYRNRTRLQVRVAPEFALGYYRFGSREFLPVRECPISSPLINRVIARLTDLGGLDCPPAVEELELFADARDENLLGWAFCRHGADEKDLLRWAEAVRRGLPNLIGLHFFSSRRRLAEPSRTNIR